jgi:hypothetical protein
LNLEDEIQPALRDRPSTIPPPSRRDTQPVAGDSQELWMLRDYADSLEVELDEFRARLVGR